MLIMLLWGVLFTRLVFAAIGMLAPQLILSQNPGQPFNFAPAVVISAVSVLIGSFLGSRVYNAWPEAYHSSGSRDSGNTDFGNTDFGNTDFESRDTDDRDADSREILQPTSVFAILLVALVALPLHFLVWRITRTQPPSVFVICLFITLLPCIPGKLKAAL